MNLSLGEKTIRDATLIEDLDGARVKTPGARAVEVLTGAAFDDDHERGLELFLETKAEVE